MNISMLRDTRDEFEATLRALDKEAGTAALNPSQQRRWDAADAGLLECRAALEAAADADRKADTLAASRAKWNSQKVNPVNLTGSTGPAPMLTEGTRGYLSLRSLPDSLRASMSGREYSLRSLLASGSTATSPVVLETSPVEMGRPASALLDVLPVRTIVGAEYSYLQQTARTNSAAPVAIGGQKPTSTMTLVRVAGSLNIVAHVSDPIHELWLGDVAALNQFVTSEMVGGISVGLENQLLNGTGTAPSLNGLVVTATGAQAYATSPVVTIRKALSQLEAAGLKASGIVLAAADWEAIETATVTGGAFLLGQGSNGAPLDSVRRTLWSVPVVVSVAHSAGTAVVIAEGSVGLVTDGAVMFAWGREGGDFSLNQVRARAEIRAEVEVFRPSGVIVCDLTA